MREGFPSSFTKLAKAEGLVIPSPEGVEILRSVQTSLAERMLAGGGTFKSEAHDESLSLHTDAENFASLLSHLEELIAEANTDSGAHRLTLVVRGMHAVDVKLV